MKGEERERWGEEVGLPRTWGELWGDVRTGLSFGTWFPFWGGGGRGRGRGRGERLLAGSLWSSPLVSVCVGVWSWLWGGLVWWWTGSDGVSVLVVLVVMVVTGGGLHEDGVADVADGMGVRGGTRGRREVWCHRYEVMKDSRVGAYGVLGLMVVMGGRYVGMVEVGWEFLVWGLVSVLPLSRVMMVLLLRSVPLAKGKGYAAGAGRPTWGVVVVTLVVGVLPGFVVWGEGMVILVMVLCGVGFVWGVVMKFFFGGITGDGCGGGVLVSECCLWWVVLGMVGRGF